MYNLKNHLKVNTLYSHPDQEIASTSEALSVPFPGSLLLDPFSSLLLFSFYFYPLI